jgi:1-deoxy-D-xylulose-5-phosphate synthase
MLTLAKQAADVLAKEGVDVAVVKPRFFKPLDSQVHQFFGETAELVITLEDHVLAGGYGSAVLELFNESGIKTPVVRVAWPDQFIEHASSVDYLRGKYGLSVDRILRDVRSFISTGAESLLAKVG